MAKIKKEESDICSQPHRMCAEGTCDNPPTEQEVKDFILENGFEPVDIEIWFDDMQGCWRWGCDIKEIE